MSIHLKDYSSYRLYLSEHARVCRLKNPRWSYASWAKELGLAGTASLTMVVNGQRLPGKKMQTRLEDYFSFNAADRHLFRRLVDLERLKRHERYADLLPSDKMDKKSRSVSSAKAAVDHSLLSPEHFASVAEWYYLCIREMTKLEKFTVDAINIQKRLRQPVSLREIRAALTALVKLGLLKKKRNQYSYADGDSDTTSDIPSEAIKLYHEGMLKNASSAIRKVSVDEREFVAATLVIHPEDLPRAKALIRTFQDEFVLKMDRPIGSQVYQMNLQFFPLTTS